MLEEGICVGCGGECLDCVECSCGRQEVYACQDCLDSDIALVCGVCRDRPAGTVVLISYPCRDFQNDVAARVGVMGGHTFVSALVGV